ncbi:MAG: hypothetical protein LC135_12255 [Phycisphaerae bacterium]|nr:hypothetical protein [Phycisphaerae bacterium]MCZ2400623.1 hypothetical protein [Phycisphaerae bacterium]NUQ49600.1 hypothetical protein [Phycisphaerae bacterium]
MQRTLIAIMLLTISIGGCPAAEENLAGVAGLTSGGVTVESGGSPPGSPGGTATAGSGGPAGGTGQGAATSEPADGTAFVGRLSGETQFSLTGASRTAQAVSRSADVEVRLVLDANGRPQTIDLADLLLLQRVSGGLSSGAATAFELDDGLLDKSVVLLRVSDQLGPDGGSQHFEIAYDGACPVGKLSGRGTLYVQFLRTRADLIAYSATTTYDVAGEINGRPLRVQQVTRLLGELRPAP